MNQFSVIKIHTVVPQQQDTNAIHVCRDYKLGDPGTYPGTETKVQKFHDPKVLKSHSLFSYPCGIMLKVNIKNYLKISRIFSSAIKLFQIANEK